MNLRDDVIEVFRDPHDETWRDQRRYRRGETIETQIADTPVRIAVDDVLGPAA